MKALADHSLVTLLRPLAGGTVPAGATAVIVHVHTGGGAYEVEVLAPDGKTIAVETVLHADLQPQ